MFSTILRTAAVFTVGLGAFWFANVGHSGPTLGEALRATAKARTVHFQVTHDGQTQEVFKADKNLRIDNADGTAVISNGTDLWQINEAENRAQRFDDEFTADEASRLLAFVNIPADAVDFNARPTLQETAHGQVYLYREAVRDPDGTRQLKATVDVETIRLLSLSVEPLVSERLHEDAVGANVEKVVDQPAVNEPAKRHLGVQPADAQRAFLELNVLAFNGVIDEDKFKVKETLTEDGRIGKLVDHQGVVALRPVNHERWSPVGGKLPVKPGDLVRTDIRGANAATVRLVKDTTVIVGPASHVEFLKPAEIRLHTGELEITADAAAPVKLLGPGKELATVAGTQFYRVVKQKLVLVDPKLSPKWLAGYKGTALQESIGSLTAHAENQPNAKDVALTVGYHKVTVDIRDQIARTTIEESFQNRTDTRMEGVFHFPLPADASISGFGLYIGDTLVEADVVEKQRAREIYETILREKKDPGLLEWTGGNIFKARIFPIEPHSERRIRLIYTQVLPMRDGRYRYSYALQSEMLKQFPLRDLQLNVLLHSASPIKQVLCPSHTVRTQTTANSASLEFSAQDYVPTRDFEVVVETERTAGGVVLIPHRRGDDGYFLVQLNPPAAGTWERDVLPDGTPQQVLLLADTSASMSFPQRVEQAEFIAAILSGLTPKDTFNVGGCDVDCDWAFPQPVPATAENVVKARQMLEQRVSLGWTDLDKAFASASKQLSPTGHLIYVGDGISTIGDANPNSAADRLKAAWPKRGTSHAVIVGSSFEAAVMQAISSLDDGTGGGGSIRKISQEQGPQIAALELLTELTRPGLRDMRVEFNGFRTARVYPPTLPNLPQGSQQIVLGRYLPAGADQSGEVIVTGRLGQQPVRFSTKVSLKDAEQGNEFIPRLWARLHLDALLTQGPSAAVRDEIIGLSEEYNIITPYTSLLVLESDADRERFKVKRRVKMRDGEKYFQKGRDDSTYELVQQQMQRAANWRLGLRRSTLRQLATLGRNLQMLEDRRNQPYYYRNGGRESMRQLGFGGSMGGMGGGGGGRGGEFWDFEALGDENMPQGLSLSESDDGLVDLEKARESNSDWFHFGTPTSNLPELLAADPDSGPLGEVAFDGSDPAQADKLEAFGRRAKDVNGWMDDGRKTNGIDLFVDDALGIDAGLMLVSDSRYDVDDLSAMGFIESGKYKRNRYSGQRGPTWPTALFPHLSPAARPAPPPKPPEEWSAEAVALSQSLLRMPVLAKITGGLEILQDIHYSNSRGEATSISRHRMLYAPAAWLARTESPVLIDWCSADERSAMNLAFQTGRTRKPGPGEPQTPQLTLSDLSVSAIHLTYVYSVPTIEKVSDTQTRLVLTDPDAPTNQHQFLIDTQRHVVLRYENIYDGKVAGTTVYDDFVLVGGTWWAQRVEALDSKNRPTSLHKLTVKALAPEQFKTEFDRELAPRADVMFLPGTLPSLTVARRNIAAGKGTLADRLVVMVNEEGKQQWTQAFTHFDQVEKLAAGKPALRWIRLYLLQEGRKNDDAKSLIQTMTAEFVKAVEGARKVDELYLTNHLVSLATSSLSSQEMLTLIESLRPLYARQPAVARAVQSWKSQRARYLEAVGLVDQALALDREVAVENPTDLSAQTEYARRLSNMLRMAEAYAWLKQTLAGPVAWEPYELNTLYSTIAELYEREGRMAELAEFAREWGAKEIESSGAYPILLSALVRDSQVEAAEALMTKWLTEGRAPNASPAANERLQAAIQLALGQGHNLYRNRPDEKWMEPLTEVALALMRDDKRANIAENIVNNWRYSESDSVQKIRKRSTEILAAEAGTVSLRHLNRLVNWMLGDSELKPETWKTILATLEKRWAETADAKQKNHVGSVVVQILRSRNLRDQLLAFQRLQIEKGPARSRSGYLGELFSMVLETSPWTDAVEAEAFALLPQLSADLPLHQRSLALVQQLHRLDDAMLAARTARHQTIEHPEKLNRIETAQKQQAGLKQAREEVVARLIAESVKLRSRLQEGIPPHIEILTKWMKMEESYFELLLEKNQVGVAGECWEILPQQPPVPDAEGNDAVDVDAQALHQRRLEGALHTRAFAMLAYLATRPKADPALVERVMKYVDAGIVAEGSERIAWKRMRQSLLIARNEPKPLVDSLRQWMQADDPNQAWRISLGYLLAEQGNLKEAISQFEAAAQEHVLGRAEYGALANWYLASNRKEDYQKSRVETYAMTEEWRLANTLNSKIHNIRNASPPIPLSDDDLYMLRALMEKGSSPQNHTHIVDAYYQHYRDFRILTVMADSVIGHTPGQVYPLLNNLKSTFREIFEEATVDQLVAQVAVVRKRATSPADQRALDLVELLAELRAAELPNRPEEHIQKALAAMQRAFKREWSPGERMLMAEFHYNIGAFTRDVQKLLASEQLRELDELHRGEPAGSYERLSVTVSYARVLGYYTRRSDGVALLKSAFNDYLKSQDGKFSQSMQFAVDAVVDLEQGQQHYADAEGFLLTLLAKPLEPGSSQRLKQLLYQVYNSALDNEGRVSLGAGQELYDVVQQQLQTELTTPDQAGRFNLTSQLCDIYRTAKRKNLAHVADDARKFAAQRLPAVLKGQHSYYWSIVSLVAAAIQTVADTQDAGLREALTLYVTEIEREPLWLRWNNQHGWHQQHSTMGSMADSLKYNLGPDLEARLLKIILAELKLDLELRDNQHRALVSLGSGYFWKAQTPAFLKVAEEVYARKKTSAQSVLFIAQYVHIGLNNPNRAIEMLLVADTDKLLDYNSQLLLVDWLQQYKREGESIAILRGMIERHPDDVGLRTRLMRAYRVTNQPNLLRETLAVADAHFHAKKLWGEGVAYALGESCVSNGLFEPAVAYLKEAVTLREKHSKSVEDQTLASYYQNLAMAHAGLGQTSQAVDAAVSAVHKFGPQQRDRRDVLNTLRAVVSQSTTLPAYIAELDATLKQTGTDRPVVRKTLGQVLLERGGDDLPLAVSQLKLAVELDPNDAETLLALINGYDALKDQAGAIAQTLTAIRLQPRNLEFYQKLAERYDALMQPQQAERARTSLVEVQANESESHTLLAQLRERQNRWGDAIDHWRRAAALRELEPLGLLGLLKAQLHEKQWTAAADTLRKLQQHTWPDRFRNDLNRELPELQKQIPTEK